MTTIIEIHFLSSSFFRFLLLSRDQHKRITKEKNQQQQQQQMFTIAIQMFTGREKNKLLLLHRTGFSTSHLPYKEINKHNRE